MTDPPTAAWYSRLPARVWDGLGIAVLLVVLAVLGWRQSHLMVIDGEPARSDDMGRVGLADFRDVIYYPLRAVREGVNPYDCRTAPLPDGSPRYRQRYPVGNLFPLYSPLLFVLYWPFGYGDFATSAWVYVLFNVGLILVWAHVCWRVAGAGVSVGKTTLLAAVMLATQSGRANFLGGETAIPLALASLAAVALAPRFPWLAGLALAIASFKPTFGLPLGVLLLAGGHFRTVVLGWGLGFAIGVAGLAIVFARSSDLPHMPQILQHNQQVLEDDPDMHARTSFARFDTAGAIQRWLPISGPLVGLLASGAVLGLAGVGLWRLRKREDDSQSAALTTTITTLATVSGIYHLTYDGLLLWAPIAIVLLAPASTWPKVSTGWRWLVAGLLLVPMFNVLGTTSVQRWSASLFSPAALPAAVVEFVWAIICTLNGLALLAALVLLVWRASRTKGLSVAA